jgi:hypothetical protein
LINQTRGLLSERGIVINQGITQVREQLPLITEVSQLLKKPVAVMTGLQGLLAGFTYNEQTHQ